MNEKLPRILVVDDDESLLAMVEHSLKFDHYSVDTVTDGDDALEFLRTNSYDLAIVDLNLPGLSGTEICSAYRTSGGKVPILMLTGQTAIADKVSGLESGADDYLTKPFSMQELHARVKALLRRAERQFVLNELVVGNVKVDPGTFRVTVNGADVHFVKKEFQILELLIRYAGRVFSADEIISRCWDGDETPSADVVRSHIRNIRKKLGDQDVVQTVHGIGYKAESV